jgi:endonuclease G
MKQAEKIPPGLSLPQKMSELLLPVFLLFSCICFAQTPADKIAVLEARKSTFQDSIARLDKDIENARFEIIRKDLLEFGTPALLPGDTPVIHSAFVLVYSEAHEQAKWVAHAIPPAVIKGAGSRTNDFRPDPEIPTGSAVEEDYFLKRSKANGEFEYDGFGYDRGHLAPSADFRWSERALSESYYYSNMSPQLAEFNRGIWADLENAIRGYIYRNPDATLYVTTGGILSDDLPVIERSVNKVAIPKFFYKVVVDVKNRQGIGFVMPNKGSERLPETYALSIDVIEGMTGLDFYHGLPDELENSIEAGFEKSVWFPALTEGDVESLAFDEVPRKKSYPATFAKEFVGKGIEVNVCGTVVDGRYSQKGNLLLNIDKKYPNQIFTVFVRKEYLVNFSYDPLSIIGKQICSKGTVGDIGGTPTMFIENEKKIEIID